MTSPPLNRSPDPRAARLGASEVAAVLGLSPWQTPWDVWRRRQPDAPKAEDSDALAWGREAEAVLVRWAVRGLGPCESDTSHAAHDGPWAPPCPAAAERWPHLGCHPDAILRYSDGREVGVEAKTGRASPEWGEAPGGQIPDHYAIQTQTQLHLTGLPAWWVVAAIRGGPPAMYGPIQPDPQIPGVLDVVEAWAVRHLIDGVEPDILQGGSAMPRVRLRWPHEERPLREATEEDARLVQRAVSATAARKAAEVEDENARAALCAAIGDAEGLATGDGWRVRWTTPKPSLRLDLDFLLAERPDLAPLVERYRKPVAASRRLTISPPKGKE